MKTNGLGQSSLAVSALGLSCMGMSEFCGQSDDAISLQTQNVAALDVTLSAHEIAWLDQLFNQADIRGGGGDVTLMADL